VDFRKDKGVLRTFHNPFEASYEDGESILQLELINLHCMDELRSKFRTDLLNMYKYLPKDKYLDLWQTTTNFWGITYFCEKAFFVMKLNKCIKRNQLKGEKHHVTSSTDQDSHHACLQLTFAEQVQQSY
jgi:hypothetical protein